VANPCHIRALNGQSAVLSQTFQMPVGDRGQTIFLFFVNPAVLASQFRKRQFPFYFNVKGASRRFWSVMPIRNTMLRESACSDSVHISAHAAP
jgi:hypothetical protein